MAERNFLGRQGQRKLEDFVYSHKDEIGQGKRTQGALADAAARRLGRPVTAGNVSGAARTMGISFPRGVNGMAHMPRMRECRAAIKLLAKELVTRPAGQHGQPDAPRPGRGIQE